MPRITIISVVVLCLALAGCSDDDGVRPKTSPYQDLSEEWHVLSNLQRACNERNVDRYAELFDPNNFVFFFNPGDVGGDIPESWRYPRELGAATNMFTGAGGLEGNPILSIELTLADIRSATWTDVQDARFPGETLRQTTVAYSYFMDTENDIQYITSGAPRARLTARNIDGEWKLVQWEDLESTLLRRAGSTQETTWGSVKALYAGEVPVYMDLSREWHVLHNLELAYNQMNIDRYAGLFDTENFTFFFNPGDAGGSIPEQWGYLDELASATHMFSGGGGAENNPILSIDLTLYDLDTALWIPVADDRFPGETLLQTTVMYSYFIDTEADIQYITSGTPRAQLSVREIDGRWELITWADHESSALAGTSAATKESSWSKVKALYR